MIIMKLYEICISKTLLLLKPRLLNLSAENPLSTLPSAIVDDLMKFATEHAVSSSINISDLEVIITSEKLHVLNLSKPLVEGQMRMLSRMLTENVCTNLRILKVHDVIPNRALRTIFDFCVNLEECGVIRQRGFDFDIFKNCRKLRILKVSNRLQKWPKSLDIPVSLQNLQVFVDSKDSNFGRPIKMHIEGLDTIFSILLENCPNLTSLGSYDISGTVERIRNQEHDHDRTFNLRRCMWYVPGDDSKQLSTVLERGRHFVSRFPLLSELHTSAFCEGSLQFLGSLKHLRVLELALSPGSFVVPELVSLLKEIGPQLKHFATSGVSEHIPVDVVLDSCPNLQILSLSWDATIDTRCNMCPREFKYRVLKKLRMDKMNEEAFVFLLSSCPNLEVLFSEHTEWLSDSILRRILRKNPLYQLQTAWIKHTSLSVSGLRALEDTAVSLERYFIDVTGIPQQFPSDHLDFLKPFTMQIYKDQDFSD